jgi:predicted metal-dependent hydrolase
VGGGGRPHPTRDPRGHSHGRAESPPPPLDPARPLESPALVRGLDLWNAGFYWEAHEAWEGLWHAAGRRGPVADLLRALIGLAAAGVKARQRAPAGVRSHARKARARLEALASGAAAPGARLAGLDLARLAALADDVAARAEEVAARGDPLAAVQVVFDEAIALGEREMPDEARNGLP